ncbi:MAG: ribonuclease HI family protein [Elusimicrobiota bacterium]
MSDKKKLQVKKIKIYIDGASKGNPGEGACSAIFLNDNGEIIAEEGRVLGICTNNFAEYSSLHLALTVARKYNAERLEILSDSELLVKQFNGEYKVKDKKLKELMDIIKKEAKNFKSITLIHIPREKNKIADNFVNNLLKAKKMNKPEQKKLQKERENKFTQENLF